MSQPPGGHWDRYEYGQNVSTFDIVPCGECRMGHFQRLPMAAQGRVSNRRKTRRTDFLRWGCRGQTTRNPYMTPSYELQCRIQSGSKTCFRLDWYSRRDGQG